jgi:hypothetical protein
MFRCLWFMTLAGMLLFTCISLLPAQPQPKTYSSERAVLKDVLIQGRDAVIQVAAEDTSSFNSMISEKVQKLVDGFLYLGDLEDVRYLQRHLKKVYGDNIAHLLEPQPTPGEALAAASHSSSSTTRSEALATIAIRQYKDGQKSEGDRTLELAVQVCLQPQDDTPFVDSSPQTRLMGVAGTLHENGYGEAANTVLLRVRELLSSSKNETGWDWRSLAERAIGTGNLSLARQAIDHVTEEEGRSDLEDELQAARSESLPPDAATRSARMLNNAEIRIRTLCSIARRQMSSGNRRDASLTLQIATDAALTEQDDTFQVFQLNDIVGVYLDGGDKDAAERIVELGLHANEKHRWGTDQVYGWVDLADRLAYLGHFERALAVAAKSDGSFFRGEGFYAVAYRQTLAGQRVDAVRWIASLKDPDERSGALLGVAKATVEQHKGGPAK